MDREKVIKGMEMCISPVECSPDDCPYYIRPNNESGLCWDRLMTDAIALLKEQDNCENCAIAIEDRQPIVRCKDCKWHTMRGEMLLCKAQDKPHTYDWFCADGVAKDINVRNKEGR